MNDNDYNVANNQIIIINADPGERLRDSLILDRRSSAVKRGQRPEEYRQSNRLAHACQAGLTLIEKRTLAVALATIDAFDTHPSLTINLPAIFIPGPSASKYRDIRRAVDSLTRRAIIMPHERGFQAIPWMAKIQPSTVDGRSGMLLTINEHLRADLTNLESHFNRIPLGEALALTTATSFRLYEILWHLYMNGHRATVDVDVQQLRFALGFWVQNVSGLPTTLDKHRRWDKLRDQLIHAIDDIHQHTRLRIEIRGNGRSGYHRTDMITFSMRTTNRTSNHTTPPAPQTDSTTPNPTAPPTEETPPHSPPPPEQLTTIRRLIGIGYHGDPLRLIDQYGLDVVRYALRIAEREHQAGRLKAPAGFLVANLKDGTAKQQLISDSVSMGFWLATSALGP